MATLNLSLDASLSQISSDVNYRDYGLTPEGVLFKFQQGDDLSSDMKQLASIFSKVLEEYETTRDNYINICENFYVRSNDFAVAKTDLESQRKRLDFVVLIIHARQEVFDKAYQGKEVLTQYHSYITGDHQKPISEIYPLERALRKQLELREGFERMAPPKRLSVLIHSSSSASLTSPTKASSLSVVSNPLEGVAITFVEGNCTQYNKEFNPHGKVASGSIAFHAVSKLLNQSAMIKIDAKWLHTLITEGVQKYTAALEERNRAAAGFGIGTAALSQNFEVDLLSLGAKYLGIVAENVHLSGNRSTTNLSPQLLVNKLNLEQALTQLEIKAKGSSDYSAGGVITSHGKSYAVKVDFVDLPGQSTLTLVDSHAYPFDDYAKSSYVCRFPDLGAASDYLHALLLPHNDGSQAESHFSMISIMKK